MSSLIVTDRPLLTIIMPVYNGEQYIERALQNISDQMFTNYELLVLDALSTDGTKKIVEAKQLTNSSITLVSKKDKGIYDAMNHGITQAKGEWVYFMGCDDALYDTRVLTVIASHLTDKHDLVYGDILWVPDEVAEQGVCVPQELLHKNINHQRIFYRKELFLQYGAYHLQYSIAADHELNIRFFCNNSIRKKYVPVMVARYHSGGFSANNMDKVFWANWKQIFRQHFSLHLPYREMYNKLGWYCRYNIRQHQYAKALVLFWDVLLHTRSMGFVWLTLKQLLQSFKKPQQQIQEVIANKHQPFGL
jgi:glycosyltransferase involved in cell wall biosynthesis